jgi:uncharacterized protein
MYRVVEFPSGGATLQGQFYYRANAPDPAPVSMPAPVVIMAHGTSATITMAIDRYAEVLHAAGLCVLLYDHRNFGLSGGEPRQQINPWIQARGYRSALDYVATLAEVDAGRVAIWGDSYAGGEVIVVGPATRA